MQNSQANGATSVNSHQVLSFAACVAAILGRALPVAKPPWLEADADALGRCFMIGRIFCKRTFP